MDASEVYPVDQPLLLYHDFAHTGRVLRSSVRGRCRRRMVRPKTLGIVVLLVIGALSHSMAVAGEAIVDLGTRSQGEDWPTFLGPRRDNKSTETQLHLNWTTAPPRLVWSLPLGESYGIGSVSRGRYFQFDYQQGHSVLLCLNSQTGELLWQFAYESDYVDLYNYSPGPRTTPVVDDDRVYIFGVEGILHCLKVEDGSLLWKVDTQKEFGVLQNFFGVGSSPVIYQDALIAVIGGSPDEDQQIAPGRLDRVRGNGSGVVAFDKRTGKVRFQLSNDLASYASPLIVQRPERDWCFVFLRGGLLAFDPATGNQDFYFPWRASILESVNASTPVVWGEHVFISETYGPGAALLRFRPGRFDVVWDDSSRGRDKAMQTHWNTSIYHNGFLYGSSGRHTQNAELRCIEAATGKVMWSQPDLTRSSLLYVDDHFICLSEYGTLRVFRATPERYDVVSEFLPTDARDSVGRDIPLLKYPAWAAPFISHGFLYVRGRDRLLCYDLMAAH